MQFERGKVTKNWVMHTADVLGSNSNQDLLVLYHYKPNGQKQVITDGRDKPIDFDPDTADEAKTYADVIMMVRLFLSFPILRL